MSDPAVLARPAAAPCPLPPPAPSFPVRWPRAYRSLAEALGPGSPLLRMGDLDPSEAAPDSGALADPVGEKGRSPLPFLLRKHPDRVVVLAASRCFFYCRFCFRRGEDPRRRGRPGTEDWERIFAWLGRHPEVEEVILSGGDPLTLPDRRLAQIGLRLADIPTVRRWRLHTRAPVVLPQRVTPGLVSALSRSPLPLRVVLHCNHPAEVWDPLLRAVETLQRAGIGVLSQSVLLAGVNDRPETLAALFRALGGAGVRPHHLHHPDPSPGNAAFRLPLDRGLAIFRGLERRLGPEGSSLLPTYVLDRPDGSGKVPVAAVLR
ncbi:MAG: KamA family radical SAM protein [Deferrisomatales bacterium]|nr:KamA family radical SAM protein [Deferrisomatales bacterium]